MINVFNIERFATHDGAGIRTVIFLKGCPLHCPWCANPESQSSHPVLMYDERKCIHCHTCEHVCPSHAISFIDEHFTYNKGKCSYTKECVNNCPVSALTFAGELKQLDEVIDEIMKDIDYYKASNGGVTISGGEPFAQFDNLLGLVKALKKQNLNVAIETCGNFHKELLTKIDPYIDTYLFDLKHMDAKAYRDICGGDLALVKQNLAALDPNKIILRVPVITGFNYDEVTLRSILAYAEKLHIKQVNFLPYHLLGKSKYVHMLMPYPWNEQTIEKETLYPYIEIAKEYNIDLKIGG